MTWKELERLAVKNGWRFLKQGGRHDIYIRNGVKIQLERHWSQEVKYGLLLSLIDIITEN